MKGMAFHERAPRALNTKPNRWYCLPCWAHAGGMSQEDLPKLGVLARTILSKSMDYEVQEAEDQFCCEEQGPRCDGKAAKFSDWGIVVRATAADFLPT